MPSVWFVVPAHGRAKLAQICLEQLRRTCDQLAARGVNATAVVVAADENLQTAQQLGFATVDRPNDFLSARFNDGIQAACDPNLKAAPVKSGTYQVAGRRGYRGHQPGTVFKARLETAAERRALDRGDIQIVDKNPVKYDRDRFTPPAGWDGKPADYVVPCGSDDWVDHRLFFTLPRGPEVGAFRHAAFVNEDGTRIVSRYIGYDGGVGIRVWSRPLMALTGYRPADEDRGRGCDTTILVNTFRAFQQQHHSLPRIVYRDLHPHQIVDWKSPGQQLNPWADIVARHRRGTDAADPFETLAGAFPAEALDAMAAHYRRTRRLALAAA